MKRKYSSMANRYKDLNISKKLFLKYHDEYMRKVVYPVAGKSGNKIPCAEEIKHLENNFHTYKSYYEGNGLHLFLDNDNLYDFLNSTEITRKLAKDTISSQLPILHPYVRKFSALDRLIPLQRDKDLIKTMKDKRLEKDFQEFNAFLYLHHKRENEFSNAFCISYSKKNDDLYITHITEIKDNISTIIFTRTTGTIYENKLFFNLISYIDAFPDMLVEGTPEERKEYVKTCKNQNARTLKSEKALEDDMVEKSEGERKTPHIRRGHFRRFTSDRYVNMKNKVIFVDSTMVKGRAKNVIDLGDSLSNEMQKDDNDSLCDEYSDELKKESQAS